MSSSGGLVAMDKRLRDERSEQLIVDADRARREALELARRVRLTLAAYQDRLRNQRGRDGA